MCGNSNNGIGKLVASAPAAAAAAIKVGDYVTGLSIRGNEATRSEGEIISFDGTAYFLKGNPPGTPSAIWADTATLKDRPASATPVAAPTPTPTTTQEAPVSNTNYPSDGRVDFNKPLRNSDDRTESATVVTVLPSGDYPILVTFGGGDNYLVDRDGEDQTGERIVENAPELATVVFGIVYRDDDQTLFSEDSYESRDAAQRALSNFDDPIGVFEVNTTTLSVDQPETSAPTASPVAGAAAGAVAGASDGPSELRVYLGGYGTRMVRVGDILRAKRKGLGTRTVEVKRLRTGDSKRSVEVQANDGTGAYWALNKNLSLAS